MAGKNASPKRLPTFTHLRLSNDAGYCELMGQLADSAQRLEEGADGLEETAYCLRVIMAFIRRDAAATEAILPGPLTLLHAALHDLAQGADPALFVKISPRGARPTNLISRDMTKAWVAGAYEKLLQAGIPAKKAADWITVECSRLGIWRPKVKAEDNEVITSRHVVRWRKDLASKQIVALQAMEMHDRLRKSKRPNLDPWEQALIVLETFAHGLMEPKRRETPPHSGSGRDAFS